MHSLHRAAKTRLLVLAAVATAALVSGPASSAPDGSCGIPEYSDTHAVGAQTPDGHYEYQSWIATEKAQKAVGGLGAELERRFGSQAEQAASQVWLARGWIGAAADHEAQEYVVVVDPALVERAELARRLGTVVRQFYDGEPGFEVKVVAGCFSSRELMAARRTLDGRRWHPDVETSSYAMYLDAYDSTYHVTFRPEDAEVAAALKEELGDLVTIDFDDISSLGRTDDGEPHYGGAAIRAGSENSNNCTSTFSVHLPGGGRGSLTAAHCFKLTGNGEANNRSVYSGPQYYGETAGSSGYPTYDMVRIHPNGETYDNKIHVDPCCPAVRTVTGAGNPNLHEFVCVSGKTTKAKCGAEVMNLDATRCYLAEGCTPNLMYAKKPGEVIAAGGDSGGPVYNRFGDCCAGARGMINAGNQSGGDYFYGHKIQAIMSHLNVTVITN